MKYCDVHFQETKLLSTLISALPFLFSYSSLKVYFLSGGRYYKQEGVSSTKANLSMNKRCSGLTKGGGGGGSQAECHLYI